MMQVDLYNGRKMVVMVLALYSKSHICGEIPSLNLGGILGFPALQNPESQD